MTLPVFWTPEANEDLLEARAWHDNIGPDLGNRFAVAVEDAVEMIAQHPLQLPMVYRRVPQVSPLLRDLGAVISASETLTAAIPA